MLLESLNLQPYTRLVEAVLVKQNCYHFETCHARRLQLNVLQCWECVGGHAIEANDDHAGGMTSLKL